MNVFICLTPFFPVFWPLVWIYYTEITRGFFGGPLNCLCIYKFLFPFLKWSIGNQALIFFSLIQLYQNNPLIHDLNEGIVAKCLQLVYWHNKNSAKSSQTEWAFDGNADIVTCEYNLKKKKDFEIEFN